MASRSKKAATTDEGGAEAGNAEVQEKIDAESEQGYRGFVADTTPNENYTVAGVTSGKPTPETTRRQGERIDAPVVDTGEGSDK